jgi:hypothetical protein
MEVTDRPAAPCPVAPRRGVVLWLVLTLTVVLSLLFFSFHLAVRQRNAQAHAAWFGQVAYNLAQSGVNLALARLREGLEDPGSFLFRDLDRAARLGALSGYRFDLDLIASLQDLTRDLGEDLDVTIEARILEARPLSTDSEQGTDPLEHDLLVEVSATGTFRGLPRTVRERRWLRLLTGALPVVGRFTLYVRSPEAARFGEPGYNRFANDIHGSPDMETVAPGDNVLPVLLYNHGDTFPSLAHDLETNGWVYLGGREDVQLNLTSGADYRYGQYFHFYNFLTSDTSRQAGFLANDAPPFFGKDHATAVGTQRFFLKHVIYGFFTVDRGNPPADMNRDGILDLALRREATTRSSSLHLFGTTLAPSPTKVFGKVYQAYPIYTGITVDVDGDGRRDGLVSLAPGVDAAGYDALNVTHPIPARVRDIGRPPETIPLDPDLVRWKKMFPSYGTYENFMSTVVRREPYNAGVDYLFARGEFPPEEQALPATAYPDAGTGVTVRRRDQPGPDGIHFQGDLGSFQAADLASRAVLKVKDQAEFERLFLWPGPTLRLRHPVLVEEGDLELPPELWVASGGLLMATGNIRFDGIQCAPGQRLSLVSLTGDLTSPFDAASPSQPVEADLVALQGRVAVTDPNHPLAVFGTVAANRFSPLDHVSGGQLVYDPRADPASPNRALKAHLADRVETWEL